MITYVITPRTSTPLVHWSLINPTIAQTTCLNDGLVFLNLSIADNGELNQVRYPSLSAHLYLLQLLLRTVLSTPTPYPLILLLSPTVLSTPTPYPLILLLSRTILSTPTPYPLILLLSRTILSTPTPYPLILLPG